MEIIAGLIAVNAIVVLYKTVTQSTSKLLLNSKPNKLNIRKLSVVIEVKKTKTIFAV